MRRGDGTVIGVRPKDLTDAGVQLHPRVLSADRDLVRFADDTSLVVSAVVWATGFTQDHRFVRVPQALDVHGRLLHDRGVTPASGLYVLGLPWLHTTGSALLGFVSRDADHLAEKVIEYSKSSRRADGPIPTPPRTCA